jgi:2-(1,2-epoxy-1,2-dihydrophenyl)acetyl-CoA isomerase
MSGQALKLDISSVGIATLTLNQAERGNPFDADFCKEFKDVFLQLWEEPSLRVVHINAHGDNFSLGGDLKFFYPRRDELSKIVRELTSDLHMGLSRCWSLPVPIVAQVQGFAMGGGVALLAGCDVVIAERKARFGSAFAQLGFSCDSGSSITLTHRMGAARAKRFVMLAEVLSADQALSCGLIDEVVEGAALESSALALVTRFSLGPTKALGEVKRLFGQASAMSLQAQLEDEALTLARVASGHDAKEGVAAFAERRKPKFQGK